MKKTVAILCDMHLSADTNSSQYAFFLRAVESIRRRGITRIFTLGDLTAFGDPLAWDLYLDAVRDFEHLEILGNADVRNPHTVALLESRVKNSETQIGERRVVGIQTPCGEIADADWARLELLHDGDVILLHYYLDALKEPSRTRFFELIESRALTVLHGHKHLDMDDTVGRSRVLGFRGLDPDKAIGGYPSVVYVSFGETVECEREELSLDPQLLHDVSRFFGISCLHLYEDLQYAIDRNIRYAELRCDKKSFACEPALIELIEEWRRVTGGFLSVHMPNLSLKDGVLTGGDRFREVLDFALLVKADHLTVHPPRRTSRRAVLDDSACFDEFLSYYVEAVRKLPRNVTVGIENLHCEPGEKCDENRCFAYNPEEVTLWIDAINEALGEPFRVGHVLDVGHARNNGSFAKQYPISRWYAMMGKRAVAYHIHQSVRVEDGQLKNHRPLDCWFGPMINYCGFFHAWETGVINRAPIFLEVKGWENHERSLAGFDAMLRT
ncbi:MAG: hypothetical protein E7637_03415 [Ruminococcaceae bacterium]|nr:hypothetical protein [Oscillospiraceae bacterium]